MCTDVCIYEPFFLLFVHFFLFTGLSDANSEYSSRVESGSTDKVLYGLGWKVDELSRLNKSGHSIMVKLQRLLDLIRKDSPSPTIQSLVNKLAKSLTVYLKGNF